MFSKDTSSLGEIKKINWNDAAFPSLLKQIPQPPKILFFLGELPSDPPVGPPKIAVVGTRKLTSDGRLLARKISRDLAEQGVVVVSGLALGIDAAAHEGAISAKGKTIAVLANGLDNIYPRENFNLAQKILDLGGAIISEYPPQTPALAHRFLERNRIISGLSLATVIIEAPIHSGSLVTAKHALEQGREVFIVPAQANHFNYQGSYLLIRNGGRLVTNAQEIIEDLNLEGELEAVRKSSPPFFLEEDPAMVKILTSLDSENKNFSIDEIIEMTGLDPQTVNQRLTLLIFEGVVKEKGGKYWRIK